MFKTIYKKTAIMLVRSLVRRGKFWKARRVCRYTEIHHALTKKVREYSEGLRSDIFIFVEYCPYCRDSFIPGPKHFNCSCDIMSLS